MSNRSSGLIVDAEALAEEYLPAQLLHREKQIKAIQECLWPATKRQRPMHVWLHGPTGSGKTALAHHAVGEFSRKAGTPWLYVNCWEHNTLYAVVDKIVCELRLLRAARSAAVTKLERLLRHLGKQPFVVILDEIDKALPKERHSILYNLLMLPSVGVVCVSNNNSFLASLDGRVKTRLSPRIIECKPYSTSSLVAILKERALLALAPDAVAPELLELIACDSAGNARAAIHTLRNATIMAESQGATQITETHIQAARGQLKELDIEHALGKLTQHHRLLYEIVKARGEVVSGELWRTYLMRCEERGAKPIALRTFSPYVNRLVADGLLTAERVASWSKARVFSLVNGA